MPAPRPPFRAAIIGAGAIARSHATALRELAGRAELVAVVDIDAQRAAAFAAEFGAARSYSEATELFANEQLDLVQICTPPRSHVPLALQSLRAGVTALVEKPLALSLRETDELLRAEAEQGAQVLTVFQHRFGGGAVRLRRLAATGALGRPLVATCETLWYRSDEYFEVPWRGRWAIEGGGPTVGHGIHQFDLLLSIFGPWSRVSAFAARQSRPTDTEDVSIAVAEFENGALATVANSVVSPRESSRLRFDYEHATVELEHLYGYSDHDWAFTPAPGHEHLAELWSVESEQRSGHRLQLAAIFDDLEAGRRAGVDLHDSRRTLEFAAATYASAFRGAPVRAGQITADDPFYAGMDGGAVPWAPVKGALV